MNRDVGVRTRDLFIIIKPRNATTLTMGKCFARDRMWYCMRGDRPRSPSTITQTLAVRGRRSHSSSIATAPSTGSNRYIDFREEKEVS